MINFGFFIPLALFFVHQLLQLTLEVHIPVLDRYADPFCATALGLYLLSWERKFLFDQHRLSTLDIISATILLILVSEVVFPHFSNRFVADWRDGIAMILGSVWFLIVSKYPSLRWNINIFHK